jgi:hypothetical protein
MKWKSKDGRVWDIKDMATPHLKNTIAMLRRNNVVTVQDFMGCVGYACSNSTGDMASDAAEGEAMAMRPWKGMEELEAELESRDDK